MIKRIRLKNFKAIKSIDVELANINILCGLNSTGKSSVIQSLLLAHQSIFEDMPVLSLKGNLINLGISKNVLYEFADDTDQVTIELDIDGEVLSIKTVDYEAQRDYMKVENKIDYQYWREKEIFKNQFNYLEAERIGPRDIYKKSDYMIRMNQIGKQGEYTPYFLDIKSNEKIKLENLILNKSSKTLIRNTEAWLSRISPNININTNIIPNTDLVTITYNYKTKERVSTAGFSPLNVGFGISYVLPVIVSLLSLSEDSLFIVENPEAHLHPKGQSCIGEMMALAAQSGAQIITETHSDHIVNGVRVAIKNKKVDHENVKIFYFDTVETNTELYVEVIEMHIDEDGNIDKWPNGFLDEWENNLMELF